MFKLSVVAQAIDSVVPQGAADCVISGINSPQSAAESELVFLSNDKYLSEVEKCRSGFVIVKKGKCIPGKICLEVNDPYLAYAKAAQLFEDVSPIFTDRVSPDCFIDSTAKIDPSTTVGPASVIGPGVIIGADCRIAAGCIIEKNTVIGSDCRIDSGVVIRWNTKIGNRVIIQSGAVIGSDGFGNANQGPVFVRIPCFGNVIIEDDADIGANTTIDRGNFEPTVIGKGVKLDNLIHIAHNVTVGENTAMAAQVGISGSTKIGKQVIIAGQVGTVGHIEIGDGTFIGAKAGVSKGTEPGEKITGYPARDLMTMRRIEAAQASLPALLKEVKQLKKEIENLKSLVVTNS
ncbi:MAG TPA: UDP-3-O-(3-hydroxymyristoyl)glucosamine N-acyltransferase [Chitinispirillaceae bacterium]|nr:UDP-3-O-(3-hydroxymyristoyl)glucosamine N-acyltransferase [Chitinispirillaceae bacterium]